MHVEMHQYPTFALQPWGLQPCSLQPYSLQHATFQPAVAQLAAVQPCSSQPAACNRSPALQPATCGGRVGDVDNTNNETHGVLGGPCWSGGNFHDGGGASIRLWLLGCVTVSGRLRSIDVDAAQSSRHIGEAPIGACLTRILPRKHGLHSHVSLYILSLNNTQRIQRRGRAQAFKRGAVAAHAGPLTPQSSSSDAAGRGPMPPVIVVRFGRCRRPPGRGPETPVIIVVICGRCRRPPPLRRRPAATVSGTYGRCRDQDQVGRRRALWWRGDANAGSTLSGHGLHRHGVRHAMSDVKRQCRRRKRRPRSGRLHGMRRRGRRRPR